MKVALVGCMVLYKTTSVDQKRMGESPLNTVQAELPAIVVSADLEEGTANLQVFLDGFGTLYVKGATLGEEPGQFQLHETHELDEDMLTATATIDLEDVWK